jgi:hypothetical protein
MLAITYDLTQFRERVRESKRALERDMIAAVEKAARAGRDEAKRGGFKDRSGYLRNGIITVSIGWSGNTYWSSFRTQMPYAWFVEEDTTPHEIWPKASYNAKTGSLQSNQSRRGRGKGPHEHVVGRGKMLRFLYKGQWVFRRMVNHPGTTGFHFMANGAEYARVTLISELHSSGFANLRSVWAA